MHVRDGDAQLRALPLKDLVCQLVRFVRHTQAVLEPRVRGAGEHKTAHMVQGLCVRVYVFRPRLCANCVRMALGKTKLGRNRAHAAE